MDTTFGRHPVIRSLDEFRAAFFDHALALPKLANLLGITYTALLAFVARPEIRQAINAARDRRDHPYADDGRQLMAEADLRALDPDRKPRTSTTRSHTRESSPILQSLSSLQPLRAPRARTTPSPLPTPSDNAHAHPPCAPALVPLESPTPPAPTPDPLDASPPPINPDIIHTPRQLQTRPANSAPHHATPPASTSPDRPLDHSTTSPLPLPLPLAARPPPLRNPAHSASFAALQI